MNRNVQLDIPDDCPACGLPMSRTERGYSYATYACSSGDTSHVYKYKWRIPPDPRINRDREVNLDNSV